MLRRVAAALCLALAGCGEEPEMGRPLAEPLPLELKAPVAAPETAYAGRADCHWRRPGLDAFRGDVRAALAALNVPATLRDRLAARIAAGQSDGTANAARSGLVSDRHVLFSPSISMTFGASTICYNTVPDFDGLQSGKLYIERGYYVWVPDICGNVSRIYPRWESRAYDRSGRNLIVPSVTRRSQPYAPMPEQEGSTATQEAPEPALVFAAGALAMFFVRKRSRRPHARPGAF